MKSFIKLVNEFGVELKSFNGKTQYVETSEGIESFIITKEEKELQIANYESRINELLADLELMK